jgi:1,2-dihydroxy-3-keto-5-methylthiopentene dioxygenase
MSTLSIYTESGERSRCLSDFSCIASTLSDLGIRFERWPIVEDLDLDADADTLLYAYRHPVDLLSRRYNFRLIDLVDSSSQPGDQALRDAHIHSDFEILFFLDGDGLFYFHVDEKVYMVMCEKGDLISLPSGTVHWFDMGNNPRFKCIRFYTDENGLNCEATGSAIANRFPSYEEFKQSLELIQPAPCGMAAMG